MIGSGALSQANLDTLQADQLATAAAVETARADVAMVELRLRYTQVTAPDDGTITSRTVSVGQIAQTGGEMLRLLRLGRIEWRAEVPEAQLMNLTTGLPVRIVTADGKAVQGKVRTIAPTVQTGNRTALVYADITGGEMADLVLDCAAGGTQTIVTAINLARKSGRIILGGWKFKDVPNFPSDTLVRRFLTVKGMRGHSFESVEIALQIIASGRYPLEALCTHVFGLGEVDEALRTVGGEGRPDPIHCAVDPWRETVSG
jgi:multidrug efflux pump subunit AcrA (membrane-fusion protein)